MIEHNILNISEMSVIHVMAAAMATIIQSASNLHVIVSFFCVCLDQGQIDNKQLNMCSWLLISVVPVNKSMD